MVDFTEQNTRVVELLEASLPRIFNSGPEVFTKDGDRHKREKNLKKLLRNSVVEYFHNIEICQMENEFYNYV